MRMMMGAVMNTIAVFAVILSLTVTHLPTAHAEILQAFGTCIKLNRYYVDRVVPLVGAYGLTSSNAYTSTRRVPIVDPSFPDTPGGPAGLRRRPYREPQRVEFSNLTSGIGGANSNDDEERGGPPEFSGTNVQVKGVNEPDIIKTDGERVFTISGPIFSSVKVLNNGSAGRRVGRLRLPTVPDDMLIDGDWIMAIGMNYAYRRPIFRRYASDPSLGEASTVVYQINVAADKPRLVSTLHLEGSYVRAREVNGVVRLVIRFNPLSSIWLYNAGRGANRTQTQRWNREIIQASQPGHWMPTYHLRRYRRVQTGVYTTCGETYHARRTFSGFDIFTVVTLPIKGLIAPSSSASVLSNVHSVYSTRTVLYVTTSEFHFGDLSDSDSRWGDNYQTSIHKFDVTNAGARYVASGAVSGSVVNQFAMHEYRGTFFIATTDGAPWWLERDMSASKVTAFQLRSGARFMRNVDEVANLGVSAVISAVRFRGETAYVVTARDRDPLYIIDLSNPRNLRVRGALRIPGFSSYLHVVSPRRVLGVGQSTEGGVPVGAKLSLFDVTDKRNPRELSSWTLAGSYASAEWDHRAFLYWRRERIAVMPVSVTIYGRAFSGAIVFDISGSAITERGRIVHRTPGTRFTPSILRNAIIGDSLWSMSSELLQVNDLTEPEDVQDQVDIS